MQNYAGPSANFVDDSTRAACSSLKSISKQLMLLNASYSSKDFTSSGPAIAKALQQVMTSVGWIQDTLTEAALAMNTELEETEVQQGPSSVIVSNKEYKFLNAVFAEYMEKMTSTSREFSLFSSQKVDKLCLLPYPKVSDQTSSDSSKCSLNRTPPPKSRGCTATSVQTSIA